MQKGTAIQDVFLNTVRKEGIQVTIHLMNGFQIKGRVRAFDSFVLLVESDARQQMVLYKHAISTITPGEKVQMPVVDGGQEGQR